MTHPPLSPHLAFIHTRLPGWLANAPGKERDRYKRRVLASHAAMRRMTHAIAPVQDIDTFCRPLLEQALPRWFPAHSLPTLDQGWVSSDGIAMSWLEAALQNFDPDTTIELHGSSTSPTHFGDATDAHTFVSGVRNLDLGQRYRWHLGDNIDTDAFRELLRQHDRAAFAAELSQATLQGHLNTEGIWMGEVIFSGLAHPDTADLQAGFLSLFDLPLNGPMLVRLAPSDQVETCLLYLPGHPHQALRQYASLQAAGAAITELLRRQEERAFFLRYVSRADQTRFATQLRTTLYPLYPYAQLHQTPPVLEQGDRFSWIKRAFPAPTDLWQETLDLNARLPLAFTAWTKDAFGERARVHVERCLQDAAAIAVPVAQRDTAAQLARIEGWLSTGLNVLNVAALFVPALGEMLLVSGGAQIVDEFLEGVHAANEADAHAAIEHLFGVFENLALFAALGAAGHVAEPPGALHNWVRIGAGDAQRLWSGELAPFTRPQPWPAGQVPGADGLYHWQGQPWVVHEGQSMPLEQTADGSYRLSSKTGTGHQPALLDNQQGTWILDHERPLSWPRDNLLQRLGPTTAGLDATGLEQALRCSGYDENVLRRVLVDHRPIPALLVDCGEALGAKPPVLNSARPALDTQLARDFPSLSPRCREEIIAQASPRDLQRFHSTQRLPLAVAETARLYLRESRISRALTRFHQPTGATADRDTLAFAALQRLPGWSGTLRLELRATRLNGDLLAAAGEPGKPTKTLVHTLQGYKPYDETGLELGGHDDLHQALLRALPDHERDAIGVSIGDGAGLRDKLFDLAASDRRRCALDLGMAPIRPQYRLPTRLPGDRRLGYRLSGRGRGWLTEDEQFDQLYPATAQGDREMLRQRLRHQAGPTEGAFARLLEELRGQYVQLDTTLQRWVNAPEGLSVGALEQQRTLRNTFAQRIRSAWRRESIGGPHENLDSIVLVLEGQGLSSLPPLTIQMPQVRMLTITGLNLPVSSNELDSFLLAFPRLNVLDLDNNALETLPRALAEMSELHVLDISENNINLEASSNLTLLEDMRSLQRLNATDIAPGLSVGTLERLATLPSLAWFQADLNELEMSAEHFLALQRWPALRGLSLGQNRIVLDEAARSALAGLSQLEMLVLYENPLGLAPDVTGWVNLQQLDLEMTNIGQWPTGLEALMRQAPLALRQVDLSANDLVDAPDLRDSAFARAVQAHPGEYAYAFNGNPFSEAAQANLQSAGFNIITLPDEPRLWSADWPPTLQAHITATAADPQWTQLYALLQRLPDTVDFRNAPAWLNQRMQYVVEALSAEQSGQADTHWGQAQVLQQINDLLQDAAQECVDQAIVLFQQVETDVTVWQAVQHAAATDADDQVAVHSARALLRQRLLDERVGTLYQARQARRQALRADAPTDTPAPALHPDDDISDAELVSDHPDELEMALMARIRLHQYLQLPPQPQNMLFPQLAHMSEATLRHLGDAVLAGTDSTALTDWMLDQPFWQAWLRRLRPQAFENLTQRWQGASEYFDSLSEPSSGSGAYTGPNVPPAFIDALQREFAHVPDLAWRVDGAVQRIDLVSGRYPNESALYQRAAELLLESRQQDEAELIRELTEIMVQEHTQ